MASTRLGPARPKRADSASSGPDAHEQPNRDRPFGLPPQSGPEDLAQDPTDDLPAMFWRAFNHSSALLIPATLALLLALAGLMLPQMPGQLNHEPATAARWLIGAAAASGVLGDLWRGLGLYNVLYHPALHIALVFMALALAVRVARAFGEWLAFRQWTHAATTPVARPGLPAPLAGYTPLQRLRRLIPASPREVDARIQHALQRLSGQPAQRNEVSYTDPNHAPTVALPPDESRTNETTAARVSGNRVAGKAEVEFRYVLARNRHFALAPLLRDGSALIAVTVAWVAIVFGWQITTPNLAPGDSFRSTLRGVEILYHTGPSTSGPFATVRTDLTGERSVASLGRLLDGDLLLMVHATTPGLLLSATDAPISMRRLGQSDSAATLGVILPAPGSEETILLPELAAGLRIARRTLEDEPWLVEYYGAGDVQPRQRWDIPPGEAATLQLPDSQARVTIEPAAGLQFSLNYMPGHRVIWVGLALMLLSLIGLVRRPFFAMLQIAPWRFEAMLTQSVREQTRELSDAALSDANGDSRAALVTHTQQPTGNFPAHAVLIVQATDIHDATLAALATHSDLREALTRPARASFSPRATAAPAESNHP